MAKNLARVLVRAQAVAQFMEYFAPGILRLENRYNHHPDLPLRCEEWNNYTDALCKNGEISDWQYEKWNAPPFCDGE
tara:strand:+ start:101 stop:331 length:231 start_codon:yes stop_codon:yes gene_type:complete